MTRVASRLWIVVACAGALAVFACGQSDAGKGSSPADLGEVVEGAAKDAVDRVEQSGQVFEKAYEKARAEGEGRLDAASEGYNAVDRHHVPVDEKPQTR